MAALVGKVTEGFGGRVDVAPRLFLRELVDVLDRIDQHPDYDPHAHYSLQVDESELTVPELAARRGAPMVEAEEPAPEPPAPAPEAPPRASRRLDG